jgi:hypothetical protein
MATKIRLDGRELISTHTLIIPMGSVCEIDLFIGPEFITKSITLPMSITFQNGSESQSVQFTRLGSRSLMTLHNWNNSIGASLTSLYELAQIEKDGVVEMMMSNHSIGTTNQLTLQFWWKVAK